MSSSRLRLDALAGRTAEDKWELWISVSLSCLSGRELVETAVVAAKPVYVFGLGLPIGTCCEAGSRTRSPCISVGS